MNQTTINRIHEHTLPGHILMADLKHKPAAVNQVKLSEHTLCFCSCKWMGWLKV